MTMKSATEHIQENGNLFNGYYISTLPIHFQNLTPNRLPNMILRKRNVLDW
jgi:hypothetical protein